METVLLHILNIAQGAVLRTLTQGKRFIAFALVSMTSCVIYPVGSPFPPQGGGQGTQTCGPCNGQGMVTLAQSGDNVTVRICNIQQIHGHFPEPKRSLYGGPVQRYVSFYYGGANRTVPISDGQYQAYHAGYVLDVSFTL